MIRPITREEVFSRSRLADSYIYDAQSPYDNLDTENKNIEPDKDNLIIEYEYITLEDSAFDDDNTDEEGNEYSWEEKGSLVKDLKDHMKPFHDGGKLTNDFAVLGYSRKNINEYVTNRSKALIRFFEIMNIRQLYLIDELKYDWLRFPFRSQEKFAAVKSLVNVPSYREAFEIDIEDLAFILPLFHDSGRWNTAIIVLISADDKVPVAMFLCDDGNFHTSFHSEDREKIFYAASAVGLVMGGVEVCSQMYKLT